MNKALEKKQNRQDGSKSGLHDDLIYLAFSFPFKLKLNRINLFSLRLLLIDYVCLQS